MKSRLTALAARRPRSRAKKCGSLSAPTFFALRIYFSYRVQSGAVLMPAYPHVSADGWVVPIAEPVPVDRTPESVAKATQAIADAFACLIARAPQDWHALQPLWTADLEQR